MALPRINRPACLDYLVILSYRDQELLDEPESMNEVYQDNVPVILPHPAWLSRFV